MTTISWKTSILSGDWSTASDWNGNLAPGLNDTVALASTTAATITVGATDAITVAAITAGTGTNDTIRIAGGSLTINGTSNIGSGLTITSGTLYLGNAITLSGNSTAAAITNGGTIAKSAGIGTSSITLGVVNSGTISATAGTLTLYGTLTETGQLSAGDGATINLNGGGTLGGTITTTGTGKIALLVGTFTQSAASLTWSGSVALDAGYQFAAAQTLTLTGNTALNATLNGAGTLITSGAVVLGGGTFQQGATWDVNGQVSETGPATLLLSSPTTSPVCTIAIGATGTFGVTDGTQILSQYGNANLTNAGTLSKTTGTGTATVSAQITNSGTISATAGTLTLSGGITNSGTLSASTGTLSIVGPLSETGQLSAGNGGTINLAGGGTLAGTITTSGTGAITLTGGIFSQSAASFATSATITLATGYQFTTSQTLTLSGNTALGANISGPGTLVTTGTAVLTGGQLQQGAVWDVNGQTSEAASASLFLYSPTAGQTATIAIAASGSLTLNDGAQITSVQNDNTITNAGTITKTSGTGTAAISGNLVNTGTISASAGTLNVGGTIANSGTITATGATLGLGAISGTGAITAGNGATVNFFGGGVLGSFVTATGNGLVELTGGTFTFGGSALNWGFHTALGSAQLNLGAGQTFTLGNVGSINGFTEQGTSGGTLITGGNTTETGMIVDQGATWQVTGTVNQQSAGLALADNASTAAQTGTLNVASTGTFNLTDNTGIGATGSNATQAGFGHIDNAGTLAKTGGTGSSTILQSVNNTGTIAANSGTLDIAGAITTTGALTVAASAALQLTGGGSLGGTLANASTTQVLLSGAPFTVGQSGKTWNGVNLASEILFTAGQSFTFGGIDTISGEVSGAGTLSLSGTTSFSAGAEIADAGTAKVTGSASITGGTMFLDGGSADPAHGTAAAAGTLAIASGGAFDFTDDLGAIGYFSVAGTVNNAGTLAKTSGTGTNTISDAVINSGTLVAQTGQIALSNAVTNSGTLSATGGSIAVSGTINDTGAITIGAGENVTLSGGGLLGGTLATTGSGVLDLTQGATFAQTGSNVTWAGTVFDQAIWNVASGQSLTLAGNDTLNGSFRQGGTVVVSGNSTTSGNGSIGLGLTMTITGTLNIAGGQFNLDAGDGITQGAGTLDVAKGGNLVLTGSTAQAVTIGYAIDQGTINNAGTISVGSDGSFATINAALTNTGTINATGGLLYLDQAVNNTGTITANGGNIDVWGALSGNGVLNVDGTSRVTLFGGGVFGTTTYNVASTATLTFLGTWTFTGSAYTLALPGQFEGSIAFSSGQVLTDNASGATLQGTYLGAGTLLTTQTITASGVSLQSGVTWEVKGTVNQDDAGNLTLNTYSGTAADAGTLRIDAGGAYNLTSNTNIVGGVNFGTVNNAGTLAKTGGTGNSIIQAYVNNTGTISVTSGSIQIDAPLANTGTLSVAANAALFFEQGNPVNSTIGGTITNGGTLTWYNGATGTFSGTVTNNGNFVAGYGTVDITGTIGGTGTLTIDSGATLELGTVPTSAQTITFAAGGNANIGNQTGAHLVLDHFGAATISGLASNDSIDLLGIALASATISGNTLTLTTTGGATATFTSNTSLAGLGTTISSDNQGGSLVTIVGSSPAAPAVSITNYDLGLLNPGNSDSVTLIVKNNASPATGGALDASFIGVSGPVTTSGTITALAPGQFDSGSLHITVAPTTTGTLNASATLGFTTVGGAKTTPSSQTISFSGVVVAAPVVQFAVQSGYIIKGDATTGYTLNLGALTVGASPLSVILGEANGATGVAANLSGSLSWGGVYGFDLAAPTSGSDLAPGQSQLNQTLTCYAVSPGTYTATLNLDSTESYGGYSASLQQVKLTVTFTVLTGQTMTYTLTPTSGMVAGDTLSNNVFIAAANTLNSSLQIFGGQGANQFQLTGGGKFNLNLPSQFNSVGRIEVHEGQIAFNGVPDTYQSVILRDGARETVEVNSTSATPGNTKPVGTTIFAGSGTYKITLGTGHDQVFLGSGTAIINLGKAINQVYGGTGSATINANVWRAGALIQGTAASSLTLVVGRAGAITLNKADTNLTVKILAGSTLNLSQGSGVTADGSTGNDTIVAHAAAQTLIGGNNDVLTSAGGDTFAFSGKFGSNTVNGFVATGTGHDTLAVSHSQFADWAHLLGATKAQGSDLLITLDASDTILLKNVALANFTSSDAKFV